MTSGQPAALQPAQDLVTRLIQIPSVNPAYDTRSLGEAELARYVAAYCTGLGMAADEAMVMPGRPNVVARLRSRSRRSTIVFEAHLDTVGLPTGTCRPKARVEGGRVYGRGACDAKGGLAAVLLALETLAADPPEHLDVVLLGTVDEEHQYRGVLNYVQQPHDATVAVVIEPTDLQPVIAHSGCVRVEISVAGVAAHSSRPHLGRNAITDAVTVMNALHAWNDERAEACRGSGPSPTLSVNRISGGYAFNVVPDECILHVDVRTRSSDEPGLVLGEIAAVLANLEPTGIRATVTATPVLDFGLDTSADTPLARAAVDASIAHGSGVGTTFVTFGTDASKLARLGGIPSIVLGPGSIDQAHSDDEWVELVHVDAAVRMYLAIVRLLDDSDLCLPPGHHIPDRDHATLREGAT